MDEQRLSDGELLDAFVSTRSEAAFEQLLQRHQRLVLGVCLRLLDEAGAEDAAQAVFLTLAHKAASLKKEGSVAGWLHRVAWQIALNHRQSAAARQRHEKRAGEEHMRQQAGAKTEAAQWAELRTALDQAVASLPAHYREPFVLHHLEELTQEETARALGEKPGTVSMRLNRAREMLRQRLASQGVNLSSAAIVALIVQHPISAAFAPGAAAATIKAAALIAAKNSAAAGALVSGSANALTQGALTMLFIARLKLVAMLLCAVLIAASGLGWAALRLHAAEKGETAGDAPPAPVKPPAPVAVGLPAPPPPPVPLTANGGELLGPIATAKRFPWAHELSWNFDNTKLLLVVDNYWRETGGGGMSREGPDDYDTYRIDLASKKVEKLYENEGPPQWLAGDRILIRLKGKLTIVEPDGKTRVLLEKYYYDTRVSRDGKHVAFAGVEKGEPRPLGSGVGMEAAPKFLLSVESGSVQELHPPEEKEKPADGRSIFSMKLGFWTDDDRFCLGAAWSKAENERNTADYSRWLVSPATGAYERVSQFGTGWSVLPFSHIGKSTMLTNNVWLALVGPKDWKDPPPPSRAVPGKGQAPAPGVQVNPMPPVMPVEGLDFTDENGKVLRHLDLDTKATGDAGLYLHCVSSDRHFALVSTYFKTQWMSYPMPVLEKTCVLDLQTGKVIAVLKTGEFGTPWPGNTKTPYPIAIFSASRQVLIGAAAYGFDDKDPHDWTKAKQSPSVWMIDDNLKAYRDDQIFSGTGRNDPDRLALVVGNPGRAQELPHQMFVFWNSAHPIRAFVSKGSTDQPRNVNWSHDGSRLAFTASERVFVWSPTNDGKEPPVPVAGEDGNKAGKEDF